MNLGLHLGSIGLRFGPVGQLNAARTADELGYDSVWAPEGLGTDAASLLAWIAGATRKVKLGSAVWQMPGRSVAMTAMTAATIDQLSGGRMILGLGASSAHISEGWHGQPFGRQLQRTREYIAAVRLALRREPLVYRGETLELPLADGASEACSLMIPPPQQPIPIYLGAVGAKNTALAGELADGWISMFFSPEHADVFRALLADGAARAGRSVDDVDVATVVYARVSDDLEAARDLIRPILASLIAGGSSPRPNSYGVILGHYGYSEAAATVRDHYRAGRLEDASRAIPDTLVDLIALCGGPALVAERIAAFRAAGVGTLLVSPLALDANELTLQLQTLAELAAA